MANRAEVMFAQTTGFLQFNGAGTQYLVQTVAGVLYLVFVDTGSDLAFKKSSDGGLTWSAPTILFTGTIVSLSVWYDRWSNIAAGLIHVAYTQNTAADTTYRTIDTEASDTLSTETVIFAGATVAAGGHLSITRALGGNVYCKTVIDAGAEGGFFRLPTANVPNGAWDAARTVDETVATLDMMILVPGFAADNQDIMAIFWDASANEISRKVYDDSGDSWGETSIATSMVEGFASNNFPHFAAAVDLTNSRIVLVAWNGIDTANSDLLGWTVTESAITAFTTPVVLDGVDDQGLAAIGIDLVTGYWRVFYVGSSDGAETFTTAVNIYTKASTDAGVTWGPETRLTTTTYSVPWMVTIPRFSGVPPVVAFYVDTTLDVLLCSVSLQRPRAAHQMFGG